MTSSGSGDDEPRDRSARPDPMANPRSAGNSWFDDVFGRPAGTHPSDCAPPGSHVEPSSAGSAGQPVEHSFDHFADQYGSEPTAPLFPIGAVPPPYRSYPDTTWPPPAQPVPTRPAAVQPVPAPPVQADQRRRRGPKTATVVAVAALTALVVGGAAGYGGTRFAAWQAAGGLTSTSSGPTSAAASPSGRLSPGSGTVSIAQQVLPSTVTIRVSGAAGDSGGTGSGLVLDRSGRILTNNHVVEAAGDGGRLQIVLADGTTVIGELVGRSPSYDLAVVQVTPSTTLVPVRLGDSDRTQVGETAIAVGSPLGLGGTVTAGIISAKNRPVAVSESSDTDAPSAYIDALQTDAPINPGNSGGPLVNSAGQVIGVNSAILTLSSNTQSQSGSIGLGFAIPINQARKIAEELIADGHATYPVIGASAVDAGSTAGSSDGVLLQDVQQGQPAAQAGLQAGDVVTAIDDRSVTQAEELIVAIRGHRPGDTVTLSYQRGGLDQQAEVLLGSREG